MLSLFASFLLVGLAWHRARAETAPSTLYETNYKGETVQAFGIDGTSLGFFGSPQDPTGIAVDSAGNVYVANDKPGGYVIQKYTLDGTSSIFAQTGLKGPHAITFDKDGNLFVANAITDSIEKFTPAGEGSVFADVEDGIVQPTDLRFDAAGNLFVTNAFGGPTGTGSVQKYTPDGVGTVFAEGAIFNTAYGIAIDSEGYIYISNFVGDNVLKFAAAGTYLGVFITAPLDGPHGMVFDPQGNLYVANNVSSTIEKFSHEGQYLGVFAHTGRGPHFLALSERAPIPTPTPTPAPPVITTQPANRSVVVGATANFKVVATGTDPLTYQWRKNAVDINKATKNAYTTPPVTVEDNGSLFSVVITNALGSVTSNDATLTVKTPPIIITQPADITVSVGATASFSVKASGKSPLAYQWRKNGTDVGGATKSSYTTPPTVAGDNGNRYSVLITNDLRTGDQSRRRPDGELGSTPLSGEERRPVFRRVPNASRKNRKKQSPGSGVIVNYNTI